MKLILLTLLLGLSVQSFSHCGACGEGEASDHHEKGEDASHHDEHEEDMEQEMGSEEEDNSERDY